MFHSARLKLTAWYLCIIMLISLSFSSVIYSVLTREVARFARAQRYRIEHRLNQGDLIPPEIPDSQAFTQQIITDPDLINETTHRVLYMLVLVNGLIFVISGGLGYILAGRTLQPIEHMIDEQNRFISDASHEFRTPLTSLKSAFEVYLRDKNLKLKDAKMLISDSINEVNKMQSLSESLLNLAQFEIPNGSVITSSVSISQIIDEAIKKLHPITKNHNITINKSITETVIKGNKDSLVNLIVILLDNAIKYSNEKSTINITAEKTDGMVTIMVIDHGVGIEEKDLSHIFDRFYRADSARSTTNVSGFGLGLSIAKKIVESHNGTIQATSVPKKKGSTFIVKLPI